MGTSYTTTLNDIINPQVMADMISAKLPKKLVVAPFAKVDNTLEGQPGNTITVPQYAYIGDAVDVAEGVQADTVKLEAGSSQVTVKKAMKAVDITDEAALSGYGDPVGEINAQLIKSIASKVDSDCLDAAINGAQLRFYDESNKIKYASIIDAIDLLNEEVNSEKVLFVNPAQVSTLRKDSDFISADKYSGQVIMTGEIGRIANCRVVPSKRVGTVDSYYKFTASGTSGALKVVASGASTNEVDLADVLPTLPSAKADDYVLLVSVKSYNNVILKLNND
ncbi:N4-gp56 family major capsid protein, partial [Treponema sp.]|uniref:N4-gp56 family major capsid protein n=1 Tax=Treponema sp. TaxID=166 RepID=UPI00388E63A0